QNDSECRSLKWNADLLQESGKRCDEKIKVLKKSKDAQIGGDAGREPKFAPPGFVLARDAEADKIIQQTGKKNQPQKPVVPPAVKEITGNNNEDVACAQMIAHQPIKQQKTREEFEEDPGIKEHACGLKIDSCARLADTLRTIIPQ